MKSIIKQIIEMDHQAKKITDAARQEKLNAERDIEKRAEALRAEYLDRARKRARINAETERTIADQKWRRIEARYKKQEERLQAVFDEQGERLAEELAARVRRGETV